MIKTEQHGMIEPRVDDNVKAIIEDQVGYVTLAEETDRDKDLLGIDEIHLCDEVILLHRSFMVGDEVYLRRHHTNIGGLRRSFVTTGHYDEVHTYEQISKQYGDSYLIHKNPAFRDHSEWEKQDD